MSKGHSIESVQQGWQCLVCGTVHSPMALVCTKCVGLNMSNEESKDVNPQIAYMYWKCMNYNKDKENKGSGEVE